MREKPYERAKMNLVELMDEKNVSVRELSRRTELSVSTVRRLRAKPDTGNLDTWKRVSAALGVSLEDVTK